MRLKVDMTFQEVELLLGKPTKIASQVYDDSTTWYYENRSVVFDNTKKCVRSWAKK